VIEHTERVRPASSERGGEMDIGNLPPVNAMDRILALGIEGSANKIGVGLFFFLPSLHIKNH
jgi:hypothetical protein